MKLSSLLLLLVGCGGPAPAPPTTSAPTLPTALDDRSDIGLDDFRALVEAGGITVVDVRTPGEFATGHVPSAVNFPIDDLDPRDPRIQRLDQKKPIYVICESGARSEVGAEQLASAGFEAVNVYEGMRAWRAAGLPVEK